MQLLMSILASILPQMWWFWLSIKKIVIVRCVIFVLLVIIEKTLTLMLVTNLRIKRLNKKTNDFKSSDTCFCTRLIVNASVKALRFCLYVHPSGTPLCWLALMNMTSYNVRILRLSYKNCHLTFNVVEHWDSWLVDIKMWNFVFPHSIHESK